MRLSRVLAAVVAVTLVLAACGNDEGGDSGDEADTVGVLPLLGTEGEVPERAALAVKVDGTERGRPQAGLADADIVFEEMVEGGLTRLIAVYHSADPETVGPVRSARSTDLSLLPELDRPLFAWSGANPTFAAAVEAADLDDVGANAAPDAYERADDRSSPYNLFADTGALRDAAEDTGTVPPMLFTYRAEGEALAGPEVADAAGYRTAAGGDLSTEIVWEWDEQSDVWVRSQDGTAQVDVDDTPITATNVIIRSTPYGDSGVRDSTGAVVPEAEAVGEGDVILLSGGQSLPGRWQKPAEDAPTTYTDLDGNPLRLQPGQTWIEVLPPDAGDTF